MPLNKLTFRPLHTISPKATAAEAAVLMREADAGILAVEEDGHLVGVVTDRDLVVRGIASGRALQQTRLDALMTPYVHAVSHDAAPSDAAQLMAEKKIHRVLVRDGRDPVGWVDAAALADGGRKSEAAQAIEVFADSD